MNEVATPSVVIFVPWFGTWPEWIRFYIESCRWNPTIDWVLISDCGPIQDCPDNVKVIDFSLAEYRDFVSNRLGIQAVWDNAYKLCDIRPAFGVIHSDIAKEYDVWGYGDIDVIYGNIRSIYNGDVLGHDLISSHSHITAGHLTLVKNSPVMNNAFKKVRGWRGLLSRKEHRGFDEYQWSHLFKSGTETWWERRSWWKLLKQRIRSPTIKIDSYFVEQFTTALYPLPWIDGGTTYPEQWYWQKGTLTADTAGDRGFLYVHLTHWQSNRWTRSDKAAWRKIDTIDHVPPGRPDNFRISAAGFFPISDASNGTADLKSRTGSVGRDNA